MAGADYLSCEGCGERLAYIGINRDSCTDKPVYCDKCYDKQTKKLDKLIKHPKRNK